MGERGMRRYPEPQVSSNPTRVVLSPPSRWRRWWRRNRLAFRYPIYSARQAWRNRDECCRKFPYCFCRIPGKGLSSPARVAAFREMIEGDKKHG